MKPTDLNRTASPIERDVTIGDTAVFAIDMSDGTALSMDVESDPTVDIPCGEFETMTSGWVFGVSVYLSTSTQAVNLPPPRKNLDIFSPTDASRCARRGATQMGVSARETILTGSFEETSLPSLLGVNWVSVPGTTY